jgi:hypothetical protein
MNVNFTQEQMDAVAILANHIEGTFVIDEVKLQQALIQASALWTNMNRAHA